MAVAISYPVACHRVVAMAHFERDVEHQSSDYKGEHSSKLQALHRARKGFASPREIFVELSRLEKVPHPCQPLAPVSYPLGSSLAIELLARCARLSSTSRTAERHSGLSVRSTGRRFVLAV